MMKMNVVTGTRLILRVGKGWSILLFKISTRTKHEKVRSREGREDDEDGDGDYEWRRTGWGSVRCTIEGDAYDPPSMNGINLFHSRYVIVDSIASHSDNV